MVQRFNRLKFKNKLIFSSIKYDEPNVVYLKGYYPHQHTRGIFRTEGISGRRFIDRFDYVGFINGLKK